MIELKYKDNNSKILAPLNGADAWLSATPEEVVRQKFIVYLVNELGYSLEQMAQELKVTNSQRGTGRASADIVIWKTIEDKNEDKHAAIVIECKSDNVTIQPADYYQGLNYATWVSADFFVTHNTKETRCFQVFKEKIPKNLGKELSRIPTASELLDDKKKEKLFQDEKVFEKDEFAKLLHQCHNIIRNNDKLSPEAAFDEISKILFTKIVFERDNRNSIDKQSIFSKKEFQRQEEEYDKNVRPYLKGDDKKTDYVQIIFRKTKEKYAKDALFNDNDNIRIRKESFLSIVEKLEVYNLSKTSDDVKGIAFEKFLGTTFRGELGQFFTPRTIVEFMTNVLDPQEGERICDPCSGSGGFLINAFEYIREHIKEDIERQKEKIKEQYFDDSYLKASEKEKEKTDALVAKLFKQLNEELNLDNDKSRLYHLSHKCIFGTDANPRMARVSKMNMIMHGDGHGGVHHNDGLLDVNGIFEERFDVILTNPPFGARVDKELKITAEDSLKSKPHYQDWLNMYDDYEKIINQREKDIKEKRKIVDKYDVGKISTLTEIMFMERCIRLLRKGGRMAIVLPEGVLNTSNLNKAREYFESRAKLILITSIPQDVFIASGATVKPSLVFLKRFTEEEENNWASITKEATEEVNAKYKKQIIEIKDKLKLRGSDAPSREDKKVLRTELKTIESQVEIEIRAIIKERFNYSIPLAEIASAGIDSKGARIKNDLPKLKDEYTQYRKEKEIWETDLATNADYKVKNNAIVRIEKDSIGNLKEIVFYAE
ncbi:N-6 DNA methylase [Saprospira sp. CCB-QB6]|uniref:N-6 DNA methylase n=1 Tax=Saprospira sp. CCB-QB6 TaxID=3023936 RepID=UPI00234BF918|nr:N-6 DNA methylase [Saprospira sp. CCB-QB6]WCL82171.1 N-6 DNA methylase [Saprospira sp. CCB-QB6]